MPVEASLLRFRSFHLAFSFDLGQHGLYSILHYRGRKAGREGWRLREGLRLRQSKSSQSGWTKDVRSRGLFLSFGVASVDLVGPLGGYAGGRGWGDSREGGCWRCCGDERVETRLDFWVGSVVGCVGSFKGT